MGRVQATIRGGNVNTFQVGLVESDFNRIRSHVIPHIRGESGYTLAAVILELTSVL